MTGKLEYRTLSRQDLGQMHRSFLESFSDYKVNMKMSREAFEDRVLSKLNIDFEVSPGVFSGDKLIAFIFQSIAMYEGQLAAYNGGTGVIPGHTGLGLTAKMYEFIAPKLKTKGVEKCVLEVLTDNHAAIRAYVKAGFKKVKEYQCLMLKSGKLKTTSSDQGYIRESKILDFRGFAEISDTQPSMLDQLAQLEHHLDRETILEYRIGNELIGFVIFQTQNGRIAQIAVDPKYRRRGIGSALIAVAHDKSENKSLSILNIETKESGIIRFFNQLGFESDLRQFEMQKSLANV